MADTCRTLIGHPSDFASRDDFAIEPDPRHPQAFERALERIRAEGLGLDDIERRHFEVQEIAGDIAAWFDEIQHDRGFVYLRGTRPAVLTRCCCVMTIPRPRTRRRVRATPRRRRPLPHRHRPPRRAQGPDVAHRRLQPAAQIDPPSSQPFSRR